MTHVALAIPVHIKRSPRAKRLSLRLDVRGGRAVLTAPLRAKDSSLQNFLAEHQGWLLQQQQALPQPISFAPNNVLSVLDSKVRLVAHAQIRGVQFEAIDNKSGLLQVGGEAPYFARRVRDWLVREAKQYFSKVAAHFAQEAGVVVCHIVVRDTKSRWGSMSLDGRLMLSWRLMLAPAFVVDYVVAHEIAHLHHFDHSPQFWRLVDKLCPRRHEAMAWLKAEGRGLLRAG